MQTCINVSSRLPAALRRTAQHHNLGRWGLAASQRRACRNTLDAAPLPAGFCNGLLCHFPQHAQLALPRAFLSSRSYSCHSARSRGSQHQARLLWVPVLSTWGCHMPCWKHSVPWSQCCKCEFVRSAESAGRAYSALCGASWRELHGLDKRIPHRVAARSSGWTSRVRSARNRDVHQVRISPSGRACGFAPLDEARLSFL